MDTSFDRRPDPSYRYDVYFGGFNKKKITYNNVHSILFTANVVDAWVRHSRVCCPSFYRVSVRSEHMVRHIVQRLHGTQHLGCTLYVCPWSRRRDAYRERTDAAVRTLKQFGGARDGELSTLTMSIHEDCANDAADVNDAADAGDADDAGDATDADDAYDADDATDANAHTAAADDVLPPPSNFTVPPLSFPRYAQAPVKLLWSEKYGYHTKRPVVLVETYELVRKKNYVLLDGTRERHARKVASYIEGTSC